MTGGMTAVPSDSCVMRWVNRVSISWSSSDRAVDVGIAPPSLVVAAASRAPITPPELSEPMPEARAGPTENAVLLRSAPDPPIPGEAENAWTVAAGDRDT